MNVCTNNNYPVSEPQVKDQLSDHILRNSTPKLMLRGRGTIVFSVSSSL